MTIGYLGGDIGVISWEEGVEEEQPIAVWRVIRTRYDEL
jgi:hypothetical protein